MYLGCIGKKNKWLSLSPVSFTAVLEESKILQAVIVGEEYVLAIVSALSDMVRLVLDHDSGSSRHSRNVKRSL